MAISELRSHKNPTAITVAQFVNAFQRIWRDSRMGGGPRAQDPRARFPSRLGLAVSGGADSMALAYLCREWEKSSSSSSSSSSTSSSSNTSGSTTTSSGANDPSTIPPGINLTAFIIDHGARAESAHEAATVATWLAALGITTRILPLDWSALTTTPHTLPAFETHARRLRFQALGRACRAARIDALLTGHHRDDAVETTLWRLCTGARGAGGLAGIPACAGVPECHGVFGVCGSRGVVGVRSSYPTRVDAGLQHQHQQPQPQPQPQHLQAAMAAMATGTLPIIRPLLGFPKSDLLATCAVHGVPFVADPTNFDPTLTPRNAIRRLLAQDQLPRALRAERVVGLMGASQRLLRRAEQAAERVLGSCRVGGFVPETGVLGVRFAVSSEGEGDSVDQGGMRGIQIQARALRRITELVAPFPDHHFPLRAFEAFVARVFQQPPQEQEPEQSFTLGGVLFQPWSLPPTKKGEESTSLFQSPAAAHTHGSDTQEFSSNSNSNSNSTQKTWLLSRQPYMKNRLPELNIHLDCTEGSVLPKHEQEQKQDQPQDQSQDQDQDPDPDQEQWHLWDNRYWFRLGWTSSSTTTTKQSQSQPLPSNPNPNQTIHLRIRPLHKSDLTRLRQTEAQPESQTERAGDSDSDSDSDNASAHATTNQKREITDPKALTRLLAQVSPGRIRFTVPVLVLVRRRRQQQQQQQQQQRGKAERGVLAEAEAEAETEEEIPLALPTLDLWLPSSRPVRQDLEWLGGGEQSLSWEWRYKMVDRNTLRLMGWEEEE
ncbi:adenine nucleotide alpha hydrolases-like protein [Aspergillus japonicus CBS 114.51]|uniref:tRNA(Ile)-lysidine synthetase n=1 Tax=Aspergillus japonicus CBS 114.51 TaxID=1448312 RepID=A0A8T8XDS7_ASPJA|nr:adenine nucleotide alpha hydrolases-like protein [Aspergillus japonicus CBS 114.51]RAH86453.1 adenine nucleotide alpha hydrolases-like protein [Aspergillus japonicus CBS 114.51]